MDPSLFLKSVRGGYRIGDASDTSRDEAVAGIKARDAHPDGGSGYRHVFVNGQVTIEDDEPTNVYSGVLLRNGRIRAGTTER